MTKPITAEAKVIQGTNPTLLARVRNPAGSLVTQAAVSAITFKTYDTAAPTVVVTSGSLDESVVIHDTLQTDARWTADTTGYNFEWIMPTANAPNTGKTYQVEVTIDLDTVAHGNVLMLFTLEVVDALSVADV